VSLTLGPCRGRRGGFQLPNTFDGDGGFGGVFVQELPVLDILGGAAELKPPAAGFAAVGGAMQAAQLPYPPQSHAGVAPMAPQAHFVQQIPAHSPQQMQARSPRAPQMAMQHQPPPPLPTFEGVAPNTRTSKDETENMVQAIKYFQHKQVRSPAQGAPPAPPASRREGWAPGWAPWPPAAAVAR